MDNLGFPVLLMIPCHCGVGDNEDIHFKGHMSVYCGRRSEGKETEHETRFATGTLFP